MHQFPIQSAMNIRIHVVNPNKQTARFSLVISLKLTLLFPLQHISLLKLIRLSRFICWAEEINNTRIRSLQFNLIVSNSFGFEVISGVVQFVGNYFKSGN